MRWRLAQAWQVVWGLPQTIVGAALLLTLPRPRRRFRFRSAIVSEWEREEGLSLGLFVFVPRDCPRPLLVHEYGHTLQSLVLGPLYLPLVVVPSLVWAGLPACRRFRARRGFSYYRFGPERWANWLSSRVMGERPVGWPPPR